MERPSVEAERFLLDRRCSSSSFALGELEPGSTSWFTLASLVGGARRRMRAALVCRCPDNRCQLPLAGRAGARYEPASSVTALLPRSPMDISLLSEHAAPLLKIGVAN